MQVLKISGRQLDDPQFLDRLAEVMKTIAEPTVIVHGGGKEISRLQSVFGVEAQYLDGLRVSDEFSLELVQMVLCGAVNPRIVELLQRGGILAQGLSGIDQGFITARKLEHPKGDLGRVGDVVSVKADLLHDLLGRGVTPVVAPICLGEDGVFNVNADHVAGAIGAAIGADRVIFLTDVGGVLHNDDLIRRLTPAAVEDLIAREVIVNGMIPKVRTAVAVLERGAKEVLITNVDGLPANWGTTVVLKSEESEVR